MSLIRNIALATVFSIPALGSGCATHDKSEIEKPLFSSRWGQHSGLNLYDEDKDNRLNVNEALKYIRTRILPEYGKDGKLTDKAIEKIRSLQSDLDSDSKNYHGRAIITSEQSSGPIISNYRDSAKAVSEALEILLKEEKDNTEKSK